jgi:hypothetical protein
MPKSYTSNAAPDGDPALISTEGVSFDLDGVTFTLHGEMDENDLVDLAVPLMDAQEGFLDPEALAAVGRFYKLIMGDETYRAFQAHRRRHRTPPPVIAEIMMDLLQEITARPPVRSSPSSAGPARTGDSSPAGSPSPVLPATRPLMGAQEIMAELAAQQPPVRAARSPAGPALDPEGIIPPDWADDVDVVLAPPPAQVPAAMVRPDAAAGTHRTINLGRPGPPAVRPLTPDEQARLAAAS